MFPTVAIHCIMRPPWICPGAPACSGNTHWTISVTVSLIDSMGRCRTGVNPSFIYHATRSKSSHGNAGLRLARRRRRRRRRALDPRTVEPMEAARVKPEISDLGARHRPVQARVERNPGNLLGKKCLSSAVNAQPLRPEGDLAGTDQQIVEPAVPVEGEVGRRRSPHRAFARRERVEQHVGIPTIGLGLGEGQIWQATLHSLECSLCRQRLDVHRDGRGPEHAANGFRDAPYLGAGTGIRRERGRHPLTYARFAEESLRLRGITEGEWNPVGRRPDSARQEKSREAGRRLDGSCNARGGERRGNGLSDLLSGEGLVLVLDGQVADPPARNGEGPLHPRGRRGRDENVEASAFEIGLAARQIRRLDQHDARALRGTPPIGGIGIEDDSAGADLGDGKCPGADPAAGAGPRVDDREHRMGQHRQKRCVGLKEVDLHGAGVGSEDLLDDAGGAPEETGPGGIRRGSHGVVWHHDAVETLGNLSRGQRRAIVEAHPVTQPEGPGQPVARDRPCDGQTGLDVAGSLAVLHEGVEHLPGNEGNRAVHRGGGIESYRNGWKPHSQGDALRDREGPESQSGEHRQHYDAAATKHDVSSYIKCMWTDIECAVSRHRCSLLRQPASADEEFEANLGGFRVSVSMAPNMLTYWVTAPTSRVRVGTVEEGYRLNVMRAIGGAEGIKWKKPNDFNSSERSVQANSLDLAENGPLY